jgi:hypothetical protein
MPALELQNAPPAGPTPHSIDRDPWQLACQQLLAAVPSQQLSAVERLLKSLHTGGCGLREWVNAIAWRGAVCPSEIPAALIDVFLQDPEAVPLHDCEDCGLVVPVRPSRLHGLEGEPDQVYFPTCPSCNGRTGWFMYWSTQAESERIPAAMQRRKPR